MRGIVLINYILAIPGILLATTIHEYFKALLSHRLGDPHPKLKGRLRLNPKRHFEPIGFLLMLLTGYGWGLPVKTTNTYYKDRKIGTLTTYVAPCLINLLFASVLFMLLLGVRQLSLSEEHTLAFSSEGFALSLHSIRALEHSAVYRPSHGPALLIVSGILYQILYMAARFNLAIGIINIIPIYPLGASAILECYLPGEKKYRYIQIRNLLLFVLLILFMSGIINSLFDPLINSLLGPIA